MSAISVFWFRNDLRIENNPALSKAANLTLPVVGLYILEENEITAQNVWLHASLKALETSLKELKIPLIFAKGSALDVWKKLIKHHKIAQAAWSLCFEPNGMKRDHQIEKLLIEHQISVIQENGTHLLEPTALSTGSGDFYKIFTPYWKMHQKVYKLPAASPKIKANSSSPRVKSLELNALNLSKNPLINLGKEWLPGEKGAYKRLKYFASHSLSHYAKERDFPSTEAHSGLSPHLHFGEISPHTVVRCCKNEAFIRELVFRDFAMQLLYHIPCMKAEPVKLQFSKWKWDNKPSFFEAWKKGMTGYPIVDAGMRELYQTGFMHNRVRMIVASFLVKDLNIAWQKGAEWFLERLLDADLASNSFNWQWSAGTGPDAQPFFRIFNPVLQSSKFDGKGIYIRKWIPELSKVPSKAIHMPWKASADILQSLDYPSPIVDHDVAKKAALREFRKIMK